MNNENTGNGARLAMAAANIARGAAAGGLHGAAIEAAKSFAPEIIKLIGILLVLFVGLPIIIIMALPNFMFGYESSYLDDIKEMNTQATDLYTAYGNTDTYTQTASEGIVADIIALFTGDEYDELDVTKDLSNLNENWFKSIISVAYQQELSETDDAAVQNMSKTKLDSSWSILSLITGGVEKKTLKIDVRDLTPDELMDKLNFTDQQRTWAGAIYETLSEEQSLDMAYADSFFGTDYGNITFTDSSIDVVYYNQGDARWANMSYGRTGQMWRSACGPTALAIAVSSLTSNKVTPPEVAKWSADNGYYVEGDGSSRALIPNGGAHYGLNVTGLGIDAQKVVDALAGGKLIVAIMAKGHFTKFGHYIVLRGVTSDGKILVADPSSVTRSNQEWALSLIVNEASHSNSAGGPFWSLGV
jgi:hypothetical protein